MAKIDKKEAIKITESKYPTQDLINNCEALGYKRYVVTGALFNCKEKEMTKTEFKECIDKFLKKEVK